MTNLPRFALSADLGQVHYARARICPRALRTPVVSPTWYVVLTNPKCEERARAGLDALGYATFLPTETVWARVPKHRQKPDQPKKVKVERPLFPGYLFFGLDKGVHPFEPVRLTDGVYSIIMNAGEYVAMPEGVVDRMMEAAERGENDKTMKLAEKLAELIGKEVSVPEGYLTGFVGTIKKATEKGADCEVIHNGKRITVRLGLETLQHL
jgi:transcription antitermination factor NusG